MPVSAPLADQLTPGGRRAFDRLLDAKRTGIPVAPVRAFLDADDIAGAYAVQRALVQVQLHSGATVTGRKIGLTAPAVQAQIGVDQPDFGVLCSDMVRDEATAIDFTGLLQPRIEAEVAFTLAADITDPECDPDSVRRAVAFASPALEIVDSRITNWDITFVDTVADNASSGLYVLGAARVALTEFEPRDCTMTMSVDGAQVSAGNGRACLGDPLNALAWLARTAITFGHPLRAGQVILSGALGPMVAVVPGAQVSAHISGLGPVRASFAAGATSAPS